MKQLLFFCITLGHLGLIESLSAMGCGQNLSPRHYDIMRYDSDQPQEQHIKEKQVVNPLNILDASGKGSLHYVAQQNNVSLIASLVALKADPSLRTGDITGDTPLHIAIKNKHPESVSVLMSLLSSSGLNARNKSGTTPLISALLYCRDKEILELLIKNPDVDCNVPSCTGHHPVSAAIIAGLSDETVLALLARSTKEGLMKKDLYEKCPLEHAKDFERKTIQDALEKILNT